MENPLLMDNYVVKALRTVLLDFKESGELHEAYKEQIQSTLESDNPLGSYDDEVNWRRSFY